MTTFMACREHSRPKEYEEYDAVKSIHEKMYTSTDSVINLIETYQTDDSILYYQLNNILSRAYYIKGNIDKAMDANEKSIAFCERSREKTGTFMILADALNNKGLYYTTLNERDNAIKSFVHSFEILNMDRKANSRKITDISINIADCYHFSGNYNKASHWYRKILLFTDSMNIKGYEMPIYSGLAKLYLDLNNFSLSNHYFKLAEQYIDTCTDYEKFFFYNSRGNYYFFTKEYQTALKWFYKAYNIINENFCRVTSSCNLGEVYLYLNDTDSAEHYIAQAEKIAGTTGDVSSMYYIKGLIIHLEILRNNLEKAERLIEELDRNNKAVTPEYIYLQNKRLQMLYAAKGEYKKAYIYNKQMQQYDDSLRNIKIINMVSENDLRYQNDTTILNKNKKIEQSQKKILKMRYVIAISILTIILMIVLFVLASTLRKKKEEQKHMKMLSTLNLFKAESLKSRISPHYVFNVINALMPGIRNHKELQYPVRCMVRLLRNGISAGNNITVELAKEIEYVNDYVTLYRLYKDNIPEITWKIDERIDTESCLIPTMIIQMPVENAVKYAFVNIENPELIIEINKKNGTEIIIQDNGIGFNPEEINNDNKAMQISEKGTGTGLKAIKEMLNLINIRKNNKITFEISQANRSGGTKIRIFIPEDFNYDIL